MFSTIFSYHFGNRRAVSHPCLTWDSAIHILCQGPSFSVLICCCVPSWVVRIVLPKSIHLRLCVHSQLNEYLVLCYRGAVAKSWHSACWPKSSYCSPRLQFLCLLHDSPRDSSSAAWLPTSKQRLPLEGKCSSALQASARADPGRLAGCLCCTGGQEETASYSSVMRQTPDTKFVEQAQRQHSYYTNSCMFKIF